MLFPRGLMDPLLYKFAVVIKYRGISQSQFCLPIKALAETILTNEDISFGPVLAKIPPPLYGNKYQMSTK